MHKDIPFEWTQAMGICDEDRDKHESFWPVWEKIGLSCAFLSFAGWPQVRLLYSEINKKPIVLEHSEVLSHILKIKQAIVAYRLTQ